jgi:hypothetical protein
MTIDKERLKYELEKAERDLEQNTFFIQFLKNQIQLIEIKEVIKKHSGEQEK